MGLKGARVIARSALVGSLSGTSTRKRWLSVRANSASTKLSKLSLLPPATPKRGRIALQHHGDAKQPPHHIAVVGPRGQPA